MLLKSRERTLPREAVLKRLEAVMGGNSRALEVGPRHYQEFLNLSDAGMENLVNAVTRAQGKEVVRVFSGSCGRPIQSCMGGVVSDTLFAVALGVARFDNFGQLKFHRRKGARPDAATYCLIEEKIVAADAMIEKAAASFVGEVLTETKRGETSN